MLNARIKNDKIKSLTVNADGITMKPKKKDYSYTHDGNAFLISFKRNYTGNTKYDLARLAQSKSPSARKKPPD